MKLINLINKLEKKYPKILSEEWDNVGLIIGDREKEIFKILICLDVTKEVVEKSIKEKVDLIISHHPIIFKSIKKILKEDFLGEKIISLIKNDISVYSLHTNLDISEDGLNDYVLDKINLNGKKIIIENKALRIQYLDREYDVLEIVKILKERLGIDNIRLSKAYNNKGINKIAITTGAGDSYINDVLNKVDLFITGDLKHHISLDAREQNLHLIDIDHYGSEKFVVDLLERELKNIDRDLNLIKFNSNEVFTYL